MNLEVHVSKLVTWGSRWGRGFRFRWPCWRPVVIAILLIVVVIATLLIVVVIAILLIVVVIAILLMLCDLSAADASSLYGRFSY